MLSCDFQKERKNKRGREEGRIKNESMTEGVRKGE